MRLSATPVAALAKGGVSAIDGKSLKGAYEKGEKSSPKMMVSAYATGLRLTLATVAARNRNEVNAALKVIGLIDPKGKIVTAIAQRNGTRSLADRHETALAARRLIRRGRRPQPQGQRSGKHCSDPPASTRCRPP